MTDRPVFWPHFSSPIRSTALTARLGRLLGIAIGICLLTGILSHYQYGPWRWLPEPASPVWGFRFTQGLHVATGTAAIPLVLIKLWSIYPNLFRWPPVRSIKHAVERGSVGVLVAATLVQLATGFANALNWYPFRWDFVPVHWGLAWVVAGSVLLHIGVKLPDIVYGLQTRVADGDVLTEIPWNDNPVSHSNAGQVPPPPTPALSRRGVLAVTGLGLGAVVLTTVGQTAEAAGADRPACDPAAASRSAGRAGEPDGRAGPGDADRDGSGLDAPTDRRRHRSRSPVPRSRHWLRHRPGSRSPASRAGVRWPTGAVSG